MASVNLNWKAIAELIALISVVASLLFVGYELRLSREVALTDSYYASEETEANLRTMINDNAIIWRKGCLGEELDESEEVVFRQLARQLNTHYFMSWRRVLDGIVSSVDSNRWPRVVALNMVHYPGFRDAWRTMESAAPSTRVLQQDTNQWVIQVEQYFEEFSSDPSMKKPDEFLCGV